MAGAKGKSGRKAHLEDKTIEEIVKLSAKTVFEALQPDSELPYEVRVELATRILIKAMPSKIDSDKPLLNQIVQVYLPINEELALSDDMESSQRTTDKVSYQ